MRTSKQVEERTKGKERKDRVRREAGKEKKIEEEEEEEARGERLSVVQEKEDMEKELVQQITISH